MSETENVCEICGGEFVVRGGKLFCLNCETPCSTCKGSGSINPLTAPPGHFCVSTEECPCCEGAGAYD